MRIIGISDFHALIEECLSNPGSFAGKSIILWKASYLEDSIAYRVIKQCCIEHNKKHFGQQVWFSRSDATFRNDDISDIKAICRIKGMYGYKSRGILFNTGVFGPKEQLNNWLKFINLHENDKGRLSNDWVLVACAQEGSYGLDESLFSDNCDIYSIQPTVDEWAHWVAQYNSQAVIKPILAFIESKQPSISFDTWQRVLHSLDKALKQKGAETLRQISEKDYDMAVRGSLGFTYPDFPFKELWDFIQSYI